MVASRDAGDLRTCRTCVHFRRGRGAYREWPPKHGRCAHPAELSEVPAHANTQACGLYDAARRDPS